MKLTVEKYLQEITNDQVAVVNADKTATQAQQKNTLTTAIQFILDQLAQGKLGQYLINVRMKKGEPVSLRFESNLINIPMGEAERIDEKLLDKGLEYPVNLYMVMESDDVNKSGLRIDELANTTDQASKIGELVQRAQEWVAQHLADVMEARA